MGLLGTYLMVSANLLTYLPHLSNEERYKQVQNIQFNRNLSIIDQHYFEVLNNLKVIDKFDIIEKSINSSFIFVTYHTGSYRLFLQLLSKKGVPFSLVTEERFIKEQGDVVKSIFKKLRENPNEELEILPAENPKLMFELMNRLRNGISVVFYIDGNTGATDKDLDKNKNLFKINFLNHHIYARQGIAYLAYLSKVPLVTAVAKRNKNLSNRLLIKPISTNSLMKKGRNGFINTITQKLYGELEIFLKKHPEQWEGWFYVDKFFKPEITQDVSEKIKLKSNKKVSLCLEDSVYLTKYDEEHAFLVTKKDYQIMKITNLLYDVLDFFRTPQLVKPKESLLINSNVVNWDFVTELIEMKLISPTQ
ncbi:MAG: hypothetical protein QM564_13885 [Bergeyella sp.]